MDAWSPRTKSVLEDGTDALMAEPVIQATVALLDAWKAKNYGHLAPFLHDFMKPKSKNAYVGDVRTRFEGTPLEDYEVLSVDVRGPGCAHVSVNITTGGEAQKSEFRWLYVDSERHVRIETDSRGTWETVQTDPLSIVGRQW